MNQDPHQTHRISNQRILRTLNPQKILRFIRNHFYVYLIVLIICGMGAFLYLKHKIPTFEVSTTILVEEDERTPGEDLLQGFQVRPGIQNLDNQLFLVDLELFAILY